MLTPQYFTVRFFRVKCKVHFLPHTAFCRKDNLLGFGLIIWLMHLVPHVCSVSCMACGELRVGLILDFVQQCFLVTLTTAINCACCVFPLISIATGSEFTCVSLLDKVTQRATLAINVEGHHGSELAYSFCVCLCSLAPSRSRQMPTH